MTQPTPAVTITARTGSRWRCGVEHGPTPIAYEAGRWSEEELEQLRADPMLVVVDGDGRRPALDGVTAPETIGEALDMALEALRNAEPDEVRRFLGRLAEDPEIRAKAESSLDRHTALADAIDDLEEGNEAHWTKAGKPECKALEEATGLKDVSAAERDAVWEDVRKAREEGE